MQIATSSVEFSFNNTMYWQIDVIAMGNLLWPLLANIFVDYHENKQFDFAVKDFTYYI